MTTKKIAIFNEHVVRELSANILISENLKALGYDTDIISTYNYPFVQALKYKPDIIVCPWFYNEKGPEKEIPSFLKKYYGVPLINLHQEQIGYTNDDTFMLGSETVNNAIVDYHFVWGEAFAEELVTRGKTDPEKIFILGSPRLDLLQGRKEKYQNTRRKLAEKHSLPIENRWVLFASTFGLTSFSHKRLKELENVMPHIWDIVEIQKVAQAKFYEWIKEAAMLFPDSHFIIRPHPGEPIEQYINHFKRVGLQNIDVIFDLPIHVWNQACDTFLTWNSTSIIEAWVAGIPALQLNLVDVPYYMEAEYLHHVTLLEKPQQLQEFANTVESEKHEGFLKKWYFKTDGLASIRIALAIDYIMSNSHTLDTELSSYTFRQISKRLGVDFLNALSIPTLHQRKWLSHKDFFDDNTKMNLQREIQEIIVRQEDEMRSMKLHGYSWARGKYGYYLDY